jgi:hypothetical protein
MMVKEFREHGWGQFLLGLIGGDKELRFDSEYDGKPLEG